MAHIFQAIISGKFASLIGLRDEYMNINTIITTFNTALTVEASKILRNERRRKKPWVASDVFGLCDERGDFKK